MRFATFNISSGRSPVDGRIDVARFADAIATLDADVLCLQEVDRDQRRSGGHDLTAIAASAMAATHQVFAPALYGTPGAHWTPAGEQSLDGPAYGCAMLSRQPMSEVQVLHTAALPLALPLWVPGMGVLPVREEPRVAIVAEIDAGVRGTVTVVGTHLPFVPGWKQRHLRRLVRSVRNRPDPLLLLGDLNLRVRAVARATGYLALVEEPTFPSTRPRIQLDHVLLRGRTDAFGAVLAATTPASVVSDHRPVVVDVDRS